MQVPIHGVERPERDAGVNQSLVLFVYEHLLDQGVGSEGLPDLCHRPIRPRPSCRLRSRDWLKLHESEVLTDEEFAAGKAKLLE